MLHENIQGKLELIKKIIIETMRWKIRQINLIDNLSIIVIFVSYKFNMYDFDVIGNNSQLFIRV